MSKLSIIIPTKNEEKNIVRLLKSIDPKLAEVILVDNFSTDKTVKLATPYLNKLFLAGPERSAQRNFGAKKASGDYLLFLDADMALSKNLIEKCLNATSEKKTIWAIKEKSIGRSFWGKALALERNCYIDQDYIIAARFFSKKDFLKIGGYDPNLPAGEDWDLTQRFINKGYRIQIINTPIIHHESTDSILNLLKKEYYYIKNIQKYAKKHPNAFKNQSSIIYRIKIWLKCWEELIKYPLLTLVFLFYKFLVWLMFLSHSYLFSKTKR
ncbi:glycosyltransferase [Candidatus Daviesbacteria bacterium]|nr:glycosyltransferase [Candidatus Daviesbacteria bacterium]